VAAERRSAVAWRGGSVAEHDDRENGGRSTAQTVVEISMSSLRSSFSAADDGLQGLMVNMVMSRRTPLVASGEAPAVARIESADRPRPSHTDLGLGLGPSVLAGDNMSPTTC
jgi:hypothetical protein